MKIFLYLALAFIAANGHPAEPGKTTKRYIDPQFLEKRSTEGRSELSRFEAMYNKDLKYGDIMPVIEVSDEEEGRNVIRFEKYGRNKWPNGKLFYQFRSGDFNSNQRNTIRNAIQRWNDQLRRYIEIVERRNNEADYVEIIDAGGCWSYLGRVGGRQELSLQSNGCVNQGTILHEFQHAIGFAHEQNRPDRDNTVIIHWPNIPREWRSQYEKSDGNDFIGKNKYDPYSIMHYPVNAPGSQNRAIEFRNSGVDERRVGNGNDFTREDLEKIRLEY